MDIDNNSFVRLVRVLKQKEQDVARIKDTISMVFLMKTI